MNALATNRSRGDARWSDRVTRPRVELYRLGAPLLRAYLAHSFVTRLRGLHALPPLRPDEALHIEPCRAVQTHRMRHAIDVAFLDTRGRILRVDTLDSGRVAICWQARAALEMTEGTVSRLGLAPGQFLSFAEHSAAGSLR